MDNWITNEEIIEALKNKDLKAISNLNFCVSGNFDTCLFVRQHEAWEIPNEGWRDNNSKPSPDSKTRDVLNFIQLSQDEIIDNTWFKVFIPEKLGEIQLSTDSNYFQIKHNQGIIKGEFSNVSSLMWDLMSGNAEPEKEIEEKFQLIGK